MYKEYNSKTSYDKRSKPATVSISTNERGVGKIFFSVEAVRLLKLQENMRIAFRFYKNDPGVMYFYQQATGFPLKKVNVCKGGIQLAVFCRPLAKNLLQEFGYSKDKSKTFLITGDTVVMPNTQCNAWLILKEKIHKPIKWRTNPRHEP